MSEVFDPEKVERWEPDEHCAGMMIRKPHPHRSFYYRQYVKSADYDKLRALYRELVPIPPDPSTLPTIAEMRGLLKS